MPPSRGRVWALCLLLALSSQGFAPSLHPTRNLKSRGAWARRRVRRAAEDLGDADLLPPSRDGAEPRENERRVGEAPRRRDGGSRGTGGGSGDLRSSDGRGRVRRRPGDDADLVGEPWRSPYEGRYDSKDRSNSGPPQNPPRPVWRGAESAAVKSWESGRSLLPRSNSSRGRSGQQSRGGAGQSNGRARRGSGGSYGGQGAYGNSIPADGIPWYRRELIDMGIDTLGDYEPWWKRNVNGTAELSTFEHMKVEELREELRRRGEDATGKKQELVERLCVSNVRHSMGDDGFVAAVVLEDTGEELASCYPEVYEMERKAPLHEAHTEDS